VQVLSELALVLDAAQRWSEAMRVYEAAIKLAPSDAVSLNNDAFLIAEHGGDLDQALTRAQRATQLLPNYPEVADTLGWIYLKKNLSDQRLISSRGTWRGNRTLPPTVITWAWRGTKGR